MIYRVFTRWQSVKQQIGTDVWLFTGAGCVHKLLPAVEAQSWARLSLWLRRRHNRGQSLGTGEGRLHPGLKYHNSHFTWNKAHLSSSLLFAVSQKILIINIKHFIVHLKKEANWLYTRRKRQIGCQFKEKGELVVNTKKESINRPNCSSKLCL